MTRPRPLFRPAPAFTVVRDNTLNGAPVLLLGHWIGADGQPESAEVLSVASTRRLDQIAGFHGENPHQLDLPAVAAPGMQRATWAEAVLWAFGAAQAPPGPVVLRGSRDDQLAHINRQRAACGLPPFVLFEEGADHA
jgi:hypothetical protein